MIADPWGLCGFNECLCRPCFLYKCTTAHSIDAHSMDEFWKTMKTYLFFAILILGFRARICGMDFWSPKPARMRRTLGRQKLPKGGIPELLTSQAHNTWLLCSVMPAFLHGLLKIRADIMWIAWFWLSVLDFIDPARLSLNLSARQTAQWRGLRLQTSLGRINSDQAAWVQRSDRCRSDIDPDWIFNFPRRVKMTLVPFIIFGLVVFAGIVIWFDDIAIHRNARD